MLIFHRFRSRAHADAFSTAACVEFGRRSQIYLDEAEAQEADPIPARLIPPIVHVERDEDSEVERAITARVEAFGGVFAGT